MGEMLRKLSFFYIRRTMGLFTRKIRMTQVVRTGLFICARSHFDVKRISKCLAESFVSGTFDFFLTELN